LGNYAGACFQSQGTAERQVEAIEADPNISSRLYRILSAPIGASSELLLTWPKLMSGKLFETFFSQPEIL
jgi:hypothetical protein